MKNIIQKLSMFEEARVFHLKFWQTPSFLFLIMGIATIASTYATYLISSRNDDPEIIILGIATIAGIVFSLGVLLVKIISRIIIISNARNEFLSLVSHQMRSPLTGTKYIFEIMLSGKSDPVTPAQEELLTQGYQANERMLLLVNDLLSLTRMAEGDTPFDYADCDITKLINDVKQESRPNADKKKIRIIMNMPTQPLPNVQCDEKKIRFVISNLVHNAIKYTQPAGTITISARTEEGKRILISVSDTGIGIPSDEIDKLFTKFYRASNADTASKIGTGLGLYIAKNIVDRHYGRIWVESEERKGSTFFVSLPLKQRRMSS